MIKAAKILVSGLLGMALVFSVNAAMDDQAIAERLKPVGQVCVEGNDCGSASAAAVSGPRSGKDIYESNCLACHGSGALGAPKMGDAAAWTARLEKGLDTCAILKYEYLILLLHCVLFFDEWIPHQYPKHHPHTIMQYFLLFELVNYSSL